MYYISEKWKDILIFNGLDTPEKIWALKAEWFEEPNYRRGGWSGVSRIELKLPSGTTMGAFLKRQEDHFTKTLRHPVKGCLTFKKEFELIRQFEEANIPSLETMLFDQWKDEGHHRAAILTVELTGYEPLDHEKFHTGAECFSTERQKRNLFNKLTALIGFIHGAGYKHNCFYPKHVFVKNLPDDEVDLRVIDLERVKKSGKKKAEFRDLYTFFRHAGGWSDEDKLDFLKIYRQETELSGASMELWDKIQNKIQKNRK